MLAREVVAGENRPSYCPDPATFQAHEWVLDAMRAAYDSGRRDGGAVGYAAGKAFDAIEAARLEAITPDDIRHWFHAHGTMHPIDTYSRAIAGDAEALRIVARDLDGGK